MWYTFLYSQYFLILIEYFVRLFYPKKLMGDTIIIKKNLLAAVLVLVLIGCMFSGCLGDKIVGTWKSTDSNATLTFNKDGTYSASFGSLGAQGTWEKTDSVYTLYYNSGKIGTATIVDKNLQVNLGFGIFSLKGDFTKQ
jgi:hypothetical protein